MDLSTLALAVLFGTGLLAGAIDAIAGGGGLITLPALLAAGLPAHLALGTNKVQGAVGAFSATMHFVQRKAINLREFIWPTLAAGTGGLVGATSVQSLDPTLLRPIILGALVVVALYVALARGLGDRPTHRRISVGVFAATAAFAIGAYDGAFGPGTGTFLAIACVSLLGMALPQATAHAKLLNLASNLAAIGVFASNASICWSAALALSAGQFVGAQVGARFVLRVHARWIRRVLVVMSIAMCVKLGLQ